MGTEFTPVFLFIVVAMATAALMIGSALLGPRKTTAVKQMPYESGMDPSGDARQRFDVRYYLQKTPDVAAAHVDPLTHYEQSGWKEGRNPSAAFGTAAYLSHNADVAATGLNPLVHYLQYGQAEGRATYAA